MPDSEEAGPKVEAARWVFVLSVERSGSTLLSGVLGGSPKIVAPPELHLSSRADFDSWCRDFPIAMESLQALWNELGRADDPARLFSGRKTLDVYSEAATSTSSASLLVDKTPGYAHDPAALARTGTLAPLYVWLVRHPLGVVHSQVSRPLRSRRVQSRRPGPQLRHALSQLRRAARRALGTEARAELRRWCESNERVERFLAQQPAGRVLVLSYEALVRDPEPQIARLCDFLGVDPDPAMLEPEANLARGLRWGIGNPRTRERRGFEPGLADLWRGAIDPALLDRRAEALLERHGLEV